MSISKNQSFPIMQRLVTFLLLAIVFPLFGQNTDPLVYTVGKIYQTAPQPHAYVLWQPGDPLSTFGREFAVYRKDGNSNSADPYFLLGRTRLQSGPGVIHALLKLGGRFDKNADSVADRINTLYADALNESGTQPIPPIEPTIEEAKKLAHLLRIAATDIKVLERLFFLGRTHPGVYMALGHGFSIKAKAGAVQTYEVREIDTGGNDLRVIGRVTLDPAKPIVLNRTSRPFEIFFPAKASHQEVVSPRNHLVTRQRWGIPDNLRRQFPHTFGFNLYRVKESAVAARGWDQAGATPDINLLESLITSSLGDEDPDAKRVNTLPLMATALLTAGEAIDAKSAPETFFAHDDNDPPTNAFEDGETFYYFVAARDIAGHPGLVSEGTRVVICDRLPPTAPTIDSITNVYKKATNAALYDLKGNQHLRLRIRQTPENPEESSATRYHIYRWSEHTQHLSMGGNPTINRVGAVSHVAGAKFVTFDDDGAGAPKITPGDTSQFGHTWWYTVRAEDDCACDPKNLSAHSPPAFGVLRDRVGPLNPSGYVSRCRYLPRVFCDERIIAIPRGETNVPDDFEGFIARFIRQDSMIRSFELEYFDLNPNPDDLLFKASRIFQISNQKDVAIPVDLGTKNNTELRVRTRSINGLVSPWEPCLVEVVKESEGNLPVVTVLLRTLEHCSPILQVTPGSTPLPHDVIGPGGSIVGPTLTATLPEDTFEYRIYRRVGNDGGYELLFRGADDDIPALLPADLTVIDPAPPTAGGTEVCYFLQVFDQNGNSSARIKIGCVTIKNGDLGTPMVSDPSSLVVSSGKAQLQLKWFCDPVGVERFEIWCASASQGDPELESTVIGPKLDILDGLIVNEESSSLNFCGYQTATVASGRLGEGAEFSATLEVPAGQRLTFAVRAVGKGSYQNPPIDDQARPAGPFSNTVSAIWSPASKSERGVIPWPALGVPGASDQELAVINYQPGEGPFYALALPEPDTHSSAILMGAFNAFEGKNSIGPDLDPLDIFFTFRRQNIHPIDPKGNETIYPFIVYRHQLPSNAYPNAVPNLVQVSPLIDRITYQDLAAAGRILRDPFFRFLNKRDLPNTTAPNGNPAFHLPMGGTFSRSLEKTVLADPIKFADVPYLRDFDKLMFWVDPLPVARGAKYQYLIVHFTDRGEVDRVIPTNPVQH